jgi:two-component system sensor kinase FixL
LAALGNYLRATQRLIEQGDSIKACAAIDVATEQVHRADQIISNLRAFAKRGKTARQAERLAAVIEEVLELALLSPEGRRMAVTIRIDPQATYADIDKIQIQQVLLNMIRNAAEAMATCPRSELLITTSRAEEGLIEISILDTGPGLAGAVLEKLFQPFVTTKADGMGIGLSICQAIIEAHGGRIWTSHKPDGGTAFHFTVPLASAEQRNNLPMGVALGALQS